MPRPTECAVEFRPRNAGPSPNEKPRDVVKERHQGYHTNRAAAREHPSTAENDGFRPVLEAFQFSLVLDDLRLRCWCCKIDVF